MPARNGRDGRDGADGRDGRDGARGLRGEQGAPGIDGRNGVDGRDLALAHSLAWFDRDDVTNQTQRVRVVEVATNSMLFTLTPSYDDDGFIDYAEILPAGNS